MNLPSFRPPLPTRPIPDRIVAHDTRAQAAENRHRIEGYLDRLAAEGLSLPAAPEQPAMLGIAQIAREAGVSLGVLRPEHPLRALIETAIPRVGLSVIVPPPRIDERLTIAQCRALFVALAKAKAVEAGLKPHAMLEIVTQLFDLLYRRSAGDASARVTPAITQLRTDAAADILDLSPHMLRVIADFDVWLGQCVNPGDGLSAEALQELPFSQLLQAGMSKSGLSQARVAAIARCRQSTVCLWLRGDRAPNARSYAGLRALEKHFEYPEHTLIESITRPRPNSGFALRSKDFPAAYRSKKHGRLRACVRAQLSESDLCLCTEGLQARISALCATVAHEFAQNCERKAMRDENRIDRSIFPPRLVQEIDRYRRHLANRGLSVATRDAYVNALEGLFHFALSEKAPSDIRLSPQTASIVHAASRPLWIALFEHRSMIGRKIMGGAFKISRSSVERMTAVSAMFCDDCGFVQSDPQLMRSLDALEPQHLPAIPPATFGQRRLSYIRSELSRHRKLWLPQSRKPTRGRDEIADLLSHSDPMIAVRQCIDYQRNVLAGISRYHKPKADGERRINHFYATALRKLVMIHLLGQTALRIGMLPNITVGAGPDAHLKWSEGKSPTLRIPAELFKNDQSDVFKEGPYLRTLKDVYGFYDDLRAYLDIGRPRLLEGAQSALLFLTQARDGRASKSHQQVLRNEITEITRDAVGAGASPKRRLTKAPHIRAHHFRDIVATAVLQRTGSYALAADAIHVTEATAREYYAHDSVSKRRPALEAVFEHMAHESQEFKLPPTKQGDHSVYSRQRDFEPWHGERSGSSPKMNSKSSATR